MPYQCQACGRVLWADPPTPLTADACGCGATRWRYVRPGDLPGQNIYREVPEVEEPFLIESPRPAPAILNSEGCILQEVESEGRAVDRRQFLSGGMVSAIAVVAGAVALPRPPAAPVSAEAEGFRLQWVEGQVWADGTVYATGQDWELRLGVAGAEAVAGDNALRGRLWLDGDGRYSFFLGTHQFRFHAATLDAAKQLGERQLAEWLKRCLNLLEKSAYAVRRDRAGRA